MPVFKSLIDVMTLGSDRPLRRLLAYYAIVAVITAVLAYFFPRLALLVAGKSLAGVGGSPQLLEDALSGGSTGVPLFGPGSLGELAITTLLILAGTLVLMLPVTWVYMSARVVPGHNQSVVQTMIILPLVVAGIIIVVQNSLALAFSLAGVVGAVRFRTTLRDTRDLVYVFLAIAVGFAAGVGALAVGALLSIVFNLVLLLTWRYDYGRNVLTPTASSQWAGPLTALASETGDQEVPDRDLVLSLTPSEANILADRFERVRETIGGKKKGKKKKKPRFDGVLTMTTDQVTEAQQATEPVLETTTKRWKLDEIVTNTGKPSEIYYLVRLKKSVPRDEVITAVRDHAGTFIQNVDLELGERLQTEDGKKE
jgi:Domain of unknown function (DUF4956)